MNPPRGVRPPPWKPIALVTTATTILLSLLLLPACCCVKGPVVPLTAPPPPPHAPDLPAPPEAVAKGPTETEMHNVDFRLDETTILRIHTLRGQMAAKKAGSPLNFDDRTSFVLHIDTGRIGMTPASVDSLMNRHVLAFPGAPLKALHASIDGRQLKQEGIIHKIVDIPFTMWADVSASDGRIRLHPTKISICGINGLGLLKAVGQTLEKMIGKELPRDRGMTADGNDLLLDPVRVLPALAAELKLMDVRVEGGELLQIFDAGEHRAPLSPPRPHEKNWMYFRSGTLRMGKLLMVDADMQVIDLDPADAFDFFIDHYNDQLVAGRSQNQPNYGLVVYMRDFGELAGR
jgi:hypothetical protein